MIKRWLKNTLRKEITVKKISSIVNEIIQTGRILYEKNLVAGFDGNISYKLKDKIITTASGVYKGFLLEEDIVIINENGTLMHGKKKASSEYKLHLNVYKNRPDVNCVIHAHPPLATATTIANIPLLPCITAEAYILLGKIPVAPYNAPGDNSLANSINSYVNKSDVILLEKHGIVSYGKDFHSCLDKIEKTEMLALKMFNLMQANINLSKHVFSKEQRLELDSIIKKINPNVMNCNCATNNCELWNNYLKSKDL